MSRIAPTRGPFGNAGLQLAIIIERLKQRFETDKALQRRARFGVLADGALDMAGLLARERAIACKKSRQPVREPGAAALVGLGGERVQPRGNTGPDFVVATAKGTYRHFKAAILVEEKEPRADPLRLRREEGGGQRLACAGASQDVGSLPGLPASWKLKR